MSPKRKREFKERGEYCPIPLKTKKYDCLAAHSVFRVANTSIGDTTRRFLPPIISALCAISDAHRGESEKLSDDALISINEDDPYPARLTSGDISDDEDFNPFLVYQDENWNIDNPDEIVLQNVENDTQQVPVDLETHPVNFEIPHQRPNTWNMDFMKNLINCKPKLNRFQYKTRTYFYAAFFGEENLNAIYEVDFGDFNKYCPKCGARYWVSEITPKKKIPGWDCCQYGRYECPDVSKFKKPSDEVIHLFRGNTAIGKNFRQNILKYNKLFATAFLQGQFKNLGAAQYGLWSLFVNGEVRWHNHAYQFEGNDDRPPNHGQLFFLDYSEDNEDVLCERRLQGLTYNQDLNAALLRELERYLRLNNVFIRCFKFTAEIQEREKLKAVAEGREVDDVVFVINPKDPSEKVTRTGTDYVTRLLAGGQYTVNPTPDFIGAVFTGPFPPITYDAMYFPREQHLGEHGPGTPQVSTRTLDIQMMPLLHLHGEGSWLVDIKCPDKVPSLGDYYRYRLAIRDDDFSVIHESKKLFAFWLLNGESRITYDKLEFIKKNQKALKVEEYRALKAFVDQEAERQHREIGRFIILPKGIYGSPRHMKDLLYDALAISQQMGHPVWMVTLTTNRNWKEISEECARSGTDVNFRFDLINRSFEMRSSVLQSDFVHQQIAGRVNGELQVTEFQGRGLTHRHWLFVMHPDDVPRGGADIDRIIWAFFPDKEKYPHLFDLVCKFMLHDRCGPEAPCWRVEQNKCRFGFPFAFSDVTDISGKKPLYRRPNDGRGVWKQVNGVMKFIDNRFVVPYNPLILQRLNAHVNIMYCPNTSACKYFYGYLLKGSHGNKVKISIVRQNKDKPPDAPYDHDEVQDYKEMRHVSAYEAHRRIMAYPFASIYPPVEVLPVHEEEKQNVLHVEGHEERALESAKVTKLTAWFDLNKLDGIHRGKLYQDVVRFYLFKDKTWTRSNRHSIGRLAPVATTVNNSELFHLRILLCNRTDITSFINMRTVNGKLHETYKGACVALNLVQNENELDDLMEELVHCEFPSVFRRTFATVLCNINPTNPLRLWEKYKTHLADDYLHHNPHVENRDVCFQLALKDIQGILEEFNKTLSYYNLPEVDEGNLVLQHQPQVIEPTLDSEYVDLEAIIAGLNVEQRGFFDTIVTCLNDESTPRLFFLTGSAGVGKTHLYNTLLAFCQKQNLQTVACAFTGIAANLLIDGLTSHRSFGLPMEDLGLGMSRSSLKLQSPEAKKLKECSLIIWDEASMVSAWMLHVVDRLLRDIMHTPDTPFGGKLLILGGDFAQILPTIPKGTRADIVDATITSSNLWSLFKVVRMTSNMRAVSDPVYADWLLKVSDGSANVSRTTRINIENNFLVDNLDDLLIHCFGKKFDKEDMHEAAILAPTNEAVNFVNKKIMAELLKDNKEKRTYHSATTLIGRSNIDEAEDQDRTHIPTEYLNSLETTGVPPHELLLAPGIHVMLIRNLRVAGGLCNGTRLKILKLYNNVIVCRILSGNKKGQTVAIFRITFYSDEFCLPGTMKRHQFPVKPCYCITINKAQGQTLIRVGLYLPTPAFVHGQFFVATSRVRNASDLKIFIESGSLQGRIKSGVRVSKSATNIFTQNPVYKEVLLAVTQQE